MQFPGPFSALHYEVSNRAEARTAPMNSHVVFNLMAIEGLRDRRCASSALTEHGLKVVPLPGQDGASDTVAIRVRPRGLGYLMSMTIAILH